MSYICCRLFRNSFKRDCYFYGQYKWILKILTFAFTTINRQYILNILATIIIKFFANWNILLLLTTFFNDYMSSDCFLSSCLNS